MTIKALTIINNVGGSKELRGNVNVLVTRTWKNRKTGRRFEGKLIDNDVIDQVRQLGITEYTPENYKDNADTYEKVKNAYENYDPSTVYFSEFDIA